MARLAAVAKALYYPTSEDATARILRTVTLRVPAGRGRILDVCAGEGQAVAALAAAWGLDAYGVELDAERATSAQTRMYRCLRGSYNQLHASKGSFHALFCNPPYDAGQDGLGNSVRLEVLFLQAATEFLATDGLLVLVVPRAILHNEKFKSLMRSRYYAARAFDYPLPERDLFDQVVVVARRQNGYAREIATTDLAVLGEDTYTPLGAPVEVKQTADLTSFVLAGRNPYDLAPSWQTDAPSGVYASSTWDALVGHAGNKVDRPLMPPRPGHQAMLLAAGALNGAEIRGRYLIKGSSEKVVDTVVEEGDKQEGDEGAIVERERVVSRLAVLDLRTGEFDAWRVNDHLEKTAAWFRDYGTDLAQAVRQLHTPEFDGNLAPYEGRLARLHAPGILPGHTEPEILQIQKEVAAAVSFHWRGSKGRKPRKTALLSGEMGTGKTSMATAAVELYGAHRAVVVCPAHLVRKWIREVETITGCKGIAVAGKKLSDVDRFFAGTGKRPARYLVLSKEIAKLGTRWEAAFTTRTEVRTREVPDVEAMRVLPYWDRRVITKQVREVVRVVACPQCGRSTGYTPRGFDRDNHQYCADCRSPLWTATALNDRGSTRWPLAEYIGQRYARRYVLVVDECHKFAGAESDQSRAIQDLASGAHKILAMTGTLYGGRASSLFYLLYKVEPSFRDRYGFKDCARFSQHFGLFETRYDLKASTSRYGTRRGGKRSGGRTKEIPGMSPAMIPLLLPYTIFVKLKDLRQELPPYAEDVRMVDHDPTVLRAIASLSKEVRKVLRKHPKVLGQYLQTCLGYPDCPEQAEEVWDVDAETGARSFIAEAPAFPRAPQPKDIEVVRIVREERAAGRQVLVFFAQTHKRDARGRVREALEAEGFRVEVLDASVQPDKREEWLEKACARGFDVLLTNGRLVETGLDLLFAKTIVQYGTEYSVPILRQSVRRSWRLGQIDPIRVVFLAYRATMQEVAMNLIARKMRAAEMVDGDETGGLADYDSSGANFFVELAQEAVASVLAEEAKAA